MHKYAYRLLIALSTAFGVCTFPIVMAEKGVATMGPPGAPKIIAHRAGKNNWPENTICGFKLAKAEGVDAFELDVQVTKDGRVVVLHPEKLEDTTDGAGAVADKTAAEVVQLDASAKFTGSDGFRKQCSPKELRIPLLTDVLRRFPNIPIVVDLKSMPAESLVSALVKEVPTKEWPRLTIYSTASEHLAAMRKKKPEATLFEDRETTLGRLAGVALSNKCEKPSETSWIGYEMVRPLEVHAMEVCDKVKLGNICAALPTKQAPTTAPQPIVLWTEKSVRCTKQMAKGAQRVFFGINTAEAYKEAWTLGADAVFTDNPKELTALRK